MPGFTANVDVRLDVHPHFSVTNRIIYYYMRYK